MAATRSEVDVDVDDVGGDASGSDNGYTNTELETAIADVRLAIELDRSKQYGAAKAKYTEAVSYTHLTLPTIYSV